MKNRIFNYVSAVCLVAGCSAMLIYGKRDDFGLNRNMEILVNLMRELATVYVDEVDPDRMMQGAAIGMVRSLDPYTEFISEEDLKNFEVMTTGKYGGIGSIIRYRDDYVRIAQPYKGSPADKAGLRIGDKILEVNGKDARGFTTDKVSRELKGEPGTMVKVKVEHLDGSVHKYEIPRQRISIPGIPYAGWLTDSIGYVRHSDFTEGCYEDMRAAIIRMHETGRLKGMILDYRSNGGGILQEAVKILGMFLPNGTDVVTTKGRDKDTLDVYTTATEPLFPDLKLAVLVNSSTASSAEIVAGSLQDMDRAVVLGQRSFGKGLVQSTRPTGYNSMVKVTTAKYYIPSGRCIQAIDYSHSQEGSIREVPDSLISEFRTRNGRKVYDGGGVMPDIETKPEYISRFAMTLYALGYIDDFGDDYMRRHPDFDPDLRTFTITEEDYADFCHFMEGKKVDFKSDTRHGLEQLKKSAEEEHFDEFAEEIKRMEEALKDDTQSNLKTYRKQLIDQINTDLIQRVAYTEGVIEHSMVEDKEVLRAIETLNNEEEFLRILREQDTRKK